MADYDTTNRGAIFPNQYKQRGDNRPDMNGNLNAVCFECGASNEYSVGAWTHKISKGDNAGKKMLSLSVEKPRERGDSPAMGTASSQDDEADLPF